MNKMMQEFQKALKKETGINIDEVLVKPYSEAYLINDELFIVDLDGYVQKVHTRKGDHSISNDKIVACAAITDYESRKHESMEADSVIINPFSAAIPPSPEEIQLTRRNLMKTIEEIQKNLKILQNFID